MINDLDPRLNVWRDDLADSRLKGRVSATKFITGKKRRVISALVNLTAKPYPQAELMSQLLLGTDVLVFESKHDYCFVQSCQDHYVGYIHASSLGKEEAPLTHYVCNPRSFIYPGPDLKLPPLQVISLGSRLQIVDFVETRGTRYALTARGFALFADHLALLNEPATDYVAIAQSLVNTPYLWGGASAFGIDCSGLVQLALCIAGQNVLRDSDMQCKTIGTLLPHGVPLQRGDLVFWRGHVGIMCDEKTLIHANGTSMDVRIEPYATAQERIAKHYGPPIAHRRPYEVL